VSPLPGDAEEGRQEPIEFARPHARLDDVSNQELDLLPPVLPGQLVPLHVAAAALIDQVHLDGGATRRLAWQGRAGLGEARARDLVMSQIPFALSG
jgi:hypothetical protein